MAMTSLFLLVFIICTVSARIDEQNHVLRDIKRNAAINQRSISKLNRVLSDHIHEVVFVVKQKNIDELERQLLSVSDPSSPSYLQFWTTDEVAKLCENKEGRDRLIQYLNDKGVTDVLETPHGELIKARSNIKVWENMFQTEYYEFEHTVSVADSIHETTNYHKQHFIRAESYEIPYELKNAVDSVLGTIEVPFYNHGRPIISPTDKTFVNVEDPDIIIEGSNVRSRRLFGGSVTPNTLRTVYNIPPGLTGSAKATQSIFSTNTDSMSPADLAQFQKEFTPNYIQSVNLAVDIVLNDTYCAVNDANNCGKYFDYIQ